jgi:hypothetical protein
MRKAIKVNYSSAEKVRLLSFIAKITLSDTELLILTELIECSTNNTITLSAENNKQICQRLAIKEGSFNVCVLRLYKKKALARDGKNIILNPIYRDLEGTTEVLLRF